MRDAARIGWSAGEYACAREGSEPGRRGGRGRRAHTAIVAGAASVQSLAVNPMIPVGREGSRQSMAALSFIPGGHTRIRMPPMPATAESERLAEPGTGGVRARRFYQHRPAPTATGRAAQPHRPSEGRLRVSHLDPGLAPRPRLSRYTGTQSRRATVTRRRRPRSRRRSL